MSLDYKEISTIIKDFIKTYFKNSGCSGVVIGLSGGVDSAVTAVLCQQALGKKKVKCIFLPDESTPKLDINHQKKLVEKYGFYCDVKDITKLVHQISDNCIVKPEKHALANVKARARMIILFEYANATNSLVCGTSNKSEILVGYFTKYGDGGVDIMPIGDLYKTQIYELASHLEIPAEIIEKPPTAGLLKGQTDEDELKMSYEKLDDILKGLEAKKEIRDIAEKANVKINDVKRIRNMRAQSQHKRRTPMIPKLGLRTSGLDWRSPVQEG